MVKSNTISTQPTTDGPSVSFGSAALGMGWQLAVIVLVPIFGGYKLDQYLGTMPVWTLVGLVLAIGGFILVIRRVLQRFGNYTPSPANSAPTDVGESTDKESDK